MKNKKYFGTDGIRGKVGEPPITAEFILQLGFALGKVLREHAVQEQAQSQAPVKAQIQVGSKKSQDHIRPKVLIGKDTRVSGYLLESALEAGLSSAGVDSLLLGPMPTPGIAYLTRALRADAGIVISASHNPYEDNGIKFFSREGFKLPDEMEMRIESILQQPMQMVDSRSLGKAQRLRDAEGRYIEFCKNSFANDLSLSRIKLVLDCAHGATYRVAPMIFRELGAEVIELGVKPDGYNINQGCGAVHPKLLAEKVIQEKADLGIALDGDGDRLIMVDHQGEIVDGDEILYIIAKWYLETDRLRGGVIGTVMSNLGLELALKRLNIPFERTAVGDRYILERLQQKSWNLGGEASGHIICLDANTTGDGIVSALRVLAAVCMSGSSLFALKQGMQKCPQVLINVPIQTKYQNAKGLVEHPLILEAMQTAQLRLNESGRILLRPSGTEPVVRVMVEGEDTTEITAVAEELAVSVRKAIEK